MDETRTWRRRQVLAAGISGMAGGLLGFFAGRKTAEPTSGADEGRQAGHTASATAASAHQWLFTVRGGYGWLFRKDKNISLLSLNPQACTCGTTAGHTDCFQHDMHLFVYPDMVDATGDYQPTVDAATGLIGWKLEGETRFFEGVGTNGVKQPRRTKWKDVKDPWGPKNPSENVLWNDQVWLPPRYNAKADVLLPSISSTEFLLTDGELTIEMPTSLGARNGRWTFEDSTGDRKKALTDTLSLDVRGKDTIGIRTKGGQILLKARQDGTPLWIQHRAKLTATPIMPGKALPHYNRLFDFVDQMDCTKGKAPVLEVRTDLGGAPTPGDLCPPLPLCENGEPCEND